MPQVPLRNEVREGVAQMPMNGHLVGRRIVLGVAVDVVQAQVVAL
jgi:hypothetical protein